MFIFIGILNWIIFRFSGWAYKKHLRSPWILILCNFYYWVFLDFFEKKLLFHEFYFENWLCFNLNGIICTFCFLNIVWLFFRKKFSFMNFISSIKFTSFWTWLYVNFDYWVLFGHFFLKKSFCFMNSILCIKFTSFERDYM